MSKKFAALCESLESRRLLAWNAAAQVIRQDVAATEFPSITGTGVTIALIDTGIDYNRPELGGGFGPGHKVKAGYDFVDNDADPMDAFGHGTNVAGVLAANQFTFNGNQYQGIAPDASLVALRFARDDQGTSDQQLEKALQWVETNYATYDISIINVSFGSGKYATSFNNSTLSDDFAKIAQLGIFVVSSSGNGGVPPATPGGAGVTYPAADANVYAAGSINTSDQISSFTQRGPTLDFLAPGEGVASTKLGGGYTEVAGTSFSAPFIAGAAALVKQVEPSFKGKDLYSVLRASGASKEEDVTLTLGNIVNVTYSRLDIDNAIALSMQRKAAASLANFGVAGNASDLAYDNAGVLHLAYYDVLAHTIQYASRSTAGVWSELSHIDTSTNDVGAYLSLAVDRTGKPAVAYYDNTNGDLDYARFDGRNWQKQILDSNKIVGMNVSLAFDANDDPAIAYYRKTSGDLRVMRFVGGAWSRTEVDTADDVGRFASVAVADDKTLGVAYADSTTGDLKYANWTGSAWSSTVVDDLRGVAFISLAFDPNSKAAISYYDAYPADLKFAAQSGSTWATQTVATKGPQGLYSNLYFDNGGEANIVFYNRKTNTLLHAFGSLGSFQIASLARSGGSFASATPSTDATSATTMFWRTKPRRLEVVDFT